MIGLVVTSTASRVRQIVQKFGLSAEKPLSLEEELAFRGIPVYSLKRVRQFQGKCLSEGPLGSKWERLSIQTYKRFSIGLSHFGFIPIPLDAQKTIEKVRAIPTTEVFVEYFDKDPFLFISRQKKLWDLKLPGFKEVCCVGYWNAPGFEP